MKRLKQISISGYKSIRDEIIIDFPKGRPLVLLGENNSGKSNIVKAIDLVLGEFWPGTKEPDDHDFWGRIESEIVINVELEGVEYRGNIVNRLIWNYDPSDSTRRIKYDMIYESGVIKYVNRDVSDQIMSIIVSADRRLQYQLSYTTKWTMLSKLMKLFHNRLISEAGRVTRLKDKFEEIKSIFNEVSEYQTFRDVLSDEFSQMFSGMSYGLDIDFSAYDPSNYFHSLRVHPVEGGTVRTFEELGTGQEQLLALTFSYAYAKAFYGGIVLIIEEPEAHLHPLAQKWLARKINSMGSDGLQIILTTHSPAFLDAMNLESFVLVRKLDNSTNVIQINKAELTEHCLRLNANPSKTSEESILPFYATSSTTEIMSGLFAKKIILVEGPTESLSLPIYFSKIGFDLEKEGIAVIPVYGKGNISKWIRFFSAFEIPVFAVYDNDNENDRDTNKRRDILKTLLIDEDEYEAIIAEEDWIVKGKYCVFGNDYETALELYFAAYDEKRSEAEELFGSSASKSSKPLVARYIADNLEVNDDPGWDKFREFKEAIESVEVVSVEDDDSDDRDEEDDLPF